MLASSGRFFHRALCASVAAAPPGAGAGRRARAVRPILDTYVRDGFVYYRALKLERAKLDGYINQLATTEPEKLSRNEQIAFWLNAYNALVLHTVIDHYPAPGRSTDYPASIRQIPGAFERLPHRVGGRTLTLDQIEQTVLRRSKIRACTLPWVAARWAVDACEARRSPRRRSKSSSPRSPGVSQPGRVRPHRSRREHG